MKPDPRRLTLLLGPLLLLAGCGHPNKQAATTRLLDQRLRTRLAPEIAAGSVVLQPLPAGVQVTLLDSAPMPGGGVGSERANRDVRNRMVESMLDPALMRVSVTDTSAGPDDPRDRKVDAVRHYFEAIGLGSTLQPVPPQQPMSSGPPGVAVTLSVQCPDRHDGAGYGSGDAAPSCD